MAAFFAYIRALRGRLPDTMSQLDEELAEYINHLYQEGDSVSLPGWTVRGSSACSLGANRFAFLAKLVTSTFAPKDQPHDVVGGSCHDQGSATSEQARLRINGSS